MKMITKNDKQRIVTDLKKEIAAAGIIAVANVESLPAKQFNSIKKKLRSSVKMKLARSSLLKMALQETGGEKARLAEKIKGPSMLMFTDTNPFKLFKQLRQSKSKTSAKPGQVAPQDIIIPAGETNLAPGPVLTELKQAKVDAKIQGPKVVIAKDSLVARKGDVLTEAVTKILSKLSIEPMEVGLNVTHVIEGSTLYSKDVLDVDDAVYISSLQKAFQQAVGLAVEVGIYNKESAKAAVSKAEMQALALKQKLNL